MDIQVVLEFFGVYDPYNPLLQSDLFLPEVADGMGMLVFLKCERPLSVTGRILMDHIYLDVLPPFDHSKVQHLPDTGYMLSIPMD